MSNPITNFSRARLMATGIPFDSKLPDLSPNCTSDAELYHLIGEYYKFFNELLWKEITFLIEGDSSHPLHSFRKLLYNLRTAFSHSDNPDASAFADRWRSKIETSQEAADIIAKELRDGLEKLGKLALAASRDKQKAARWSELLTLDTNTIFRQVENDFGLSFTRNNRARMIRQVEKRLEIKKPSGDRRVVIADFCAQEMLSGHGILPVPYGQILDALDLLGSREASGAILVAYSVAKINPSLKNDIFLSRVKDAWILARKS